jgi:putative ribosome biogenesis GTPase RsgA
VVKEALETGEIAVFRFQDYLSILETTSQK